MSIAKVTEIKASKTIDGNAGAWLGSQQVSVDDGEITEDPVQMKITLVLG
ncbi:MAG: hypothetical protein ACJASY_003044 [Halioglobus sp.]|jgi:hypothetical protein